MASTIIIYEGDGTTTDFTVPFDYLKKSFVTVRLGTGTTLTGGDYGDTGSDYYFLDKTTIRLKVAPASGESLTIRRYTSATERVVTFKDASILKATDLDTSQVQAFHIAEEGRDILEDSLSVNREGNWDAKGKRIINVGTPEADSDAMTYGVYKTDAKGAYQAKLDAEAARDAAKVSETNAKASEVNAKESEVTAKASAGTAVSAAKHADAVKTENQAILEEARQLQTNIETSESNVYENSVIATQKADEAKVSERNAKVSEVNAKASEVEAKKQADLAKGYAEDSASGQLNADWEVTDPKSKAFIKNKPTLGALASKDSIAYSEITGTPPEQDLSGLATKTELQTGLAGKANASHTHTTAQVTGLDTALAGKAPMSHTHTIANVTGLQVDLTAIRESITNVSSKVDGLGEIPTPKAYVTETHVSGTQGYRVWSDGFIEQWGKVTVPGENADKTLTFQKPFKNANYNIQTAGWWITDRHACVTSKTATSVTLRAWGNDNDWYAFGY